MHLTVRTPSVSRPSPALPAQRKRAAPARPPVQQSGYVDPRGGEYMKRMAKARNVLEDRQMMRDLGLLDEL